MNIRSEKINKRQQVLDTMLRLISEYGYSGTPMSLVCKEAGVAAGTVYHHFPSKDAILVALYETHKTQMGIALQENIDPDLGYKKRFAKYWDNLFKFYTNHPAEFRFLEYCYNSPYIPIEVKHDNIKHYASVIDFLNEGIKKEKIKKMDVELALSLVNGTVVSATQLYLSNPDLFTDEMKNKSRQFAWDGLSG